MAASRPAAGCPLRPDSASALPGRPGLAPLARIVEHGCVGTQRCVVIGAGVLGASVAARLAAAGVRVTLLDQDEPGQGTSRATAAYFPEEGYLLTEPLIARRW